MVRNSSDSDSSSDKALLIFRSIIYEDEIFLSNIDSDDMFVDHRRTLSHVVDVGPTNVGDVSVSPASDGPFGSTFDVGFVILHPIYKNNSGDNPLNVKAMNSNFCFIVFAIYIKKI